MISNLQEYFADKEIVQVCSRAGRPCWYYDSLGLTLSVSAGLGSDPLMESSQRTEFKKSMRTVISSGKREKAEEATLTS